MKKITNEELLDETIEYYKTHPRAMNENGTCQYLTNEGNMCAIGRCLTKKGFQDVNIIDNKGYVVNGSLNLKTLRPLLKSKYKKITFWEDLQYLHDRDLLWSPNETGGNDLSSVGLGYVEQLKQIWQQL